MDSRIEEACEGGLESRGGGSGGFEGGVGDGDGFELSARGTMTLLTSAISTLTHPKCSAKTSESPVSIFKACKIWTCKERDLSGTGGA